MASKTFYILANTATAPGYHSSLQDGGSAPAAAAVAYGWTVAKVAAAYWRGRIGATARATASQAGTFLTQTAPAIGTGTGATTAGDCFVSPTPLSGTFAAGNWVANFGMRTGAANNAGRIRFQLWAGTSRDGAGARKIGAAQDCSAVTMASTAATYTSTLTWNPAAITLVNEYLFFEVEWQNTNTGGSNSCSALFRQGESSIVTTDFVPVIDGTGTLAYATNPATLASAGISLSTGDGGLTNPDGAVLDADGTAQEPPAYGDGVLITLEAVLAGGGVAQDTIDGYGDIVASDSALAATGAAANVIGGSGSLIASAASTGGIVPWTPSVIPNLSAHLDASGLGLADGASILTWPNLAAGGTPTTVEWNFTPVTYKADALNGMGVARFSGGNSSHVHGKTNATFSFTAVFIVRRWGPVIGRCFSSQYPPVNMLAGFHATGQDVAYDASGWITTGIPWDGGLPGPWKMYGMEVMDSPPTSTFTVNGVWKAQSGVGGSGGLGGGYALSSYRGDSQVDETMDCDIAEVVLYDKLISQDERKLVEGYLAHKWGVTGNLAVDHPYKTVMPTAGVASSGAVGSTGTGTLTATGNVLAAVGLSVSLGDGTLTPTATVIAGTGGSAQTTVEGTGALNQLSASLSGAGAVRAIGTSVLFAGVATSAGAGLGATTGTGVLASITATLAASVVSGATGAGVLGYGVSRVSPVNMVSNTAPPPYVTGSSNELTGYEAWHAFDGNPASPAHSNDALTTFPYWLKIDLGAPRSVASYLYQARNVGPYHAWKTWTLEGSNDDSAWNLVDTVIDEPTFAVSETRSYNCDTPSIYRYWRWSVTASSGISGTYAEVGTLELVSTAGLAVSALLASGTSRSYGSGTLVSDTVEVYGTEALSFLGGVLVMREAKIVGTGVSSARGYGDLLPHLAA